MKARARIKLSKLISGTIGKIIFTIINVLIALIIIYPFINLLAISLSDIAPVRTGHVTFFPLLNRDGKEFFGANGAAWLAVIQYRYIYLSILNTLRNAVLGCLFVVGLTALAAYPWACIDFKLKPVYTKFIMITMWLNVGTIPYYLVTADLGLIGSFWSLIIPSIFTPFNILVTKNYFLGIPKSVLEAAKIDGANDFRIFLTIVLPSSLPILATLTLWTFVLQWNNYQGPLLYMQTLDKSKWVLQQVLASLIKANEAEEILSVGTNLTVGEEQISNATVLFSILPLLLMFPLFQKFLVAGTNVGSVKE